MEIPVSEPARPAGEERELLFVAGQITLHGPASAPMEVRRGMPVRCRDGEEAGQVAAVVVDLDSHAVTHVLLSRWREVLDYRLVPASLVVGVREGIVALEIPASAVDNLPARAATGTPGGRQVLENPDRH